MKTGQLSDFLQKMDAEIETNISKLEIIIPDDLDEPTKIKFELKKVSKRALK